MMVNARSSVFNPLQTLNFSIGGFSLAVYLKSDNLWVFVPSLVLLVYSLYRHERWANESPHMLSNESVQLHGMDLKMGSSDRPALPESTVDAMTPVVNPEPIEGEVVETATEGEQAEAETR